VINQPLFVNEGTGADFHSTLDTLYLCQARALDLNHTQVPPSDGYPNAVFYHGSDNGLVVWFGFPMYYFDPDLARQTARVVLKNLGLVPKPPAPVAARMSVTAAAPAPQRPVMSILQGRSR
jgi:hypothetical protein